MNSHIAYICPKCGRTITTDPPLPADGVIACPVDGQRVMPVRTGQAVRTPA